MKLNLVFTLNALAALAFGLGFVLAPATVVDRKRTASPLRTGSPF